MGQAVKSTKSEAEYEPKSKNPATVCRKCVHFDAPDGCERVKGVIDPGAWCRFFKASNGLKGMAR